jgi:hypothetical protein
MHEEVLRDFLAGRTGAWRLRRELGDARGASLSVEPMTVSFDLFPHHLLTLLDAVLEGELEPPLLPPLAHWMHASARFHVARTDPDGRVVEEVLVAWSESAGRLRDPGDLAPFREWLLTRRRPLPLPPDLL